LCPRGRFGRGDKQMIQLSELLKKAFGEYDGPPSAGTIEISGICEDSRKIKPGNLFVAVPGAKADGAAFVRHSIANGADAIVAGREASVDASCPIIRVTDPREAVARLAAVFHGLDSIQSHGELTAIGITGTNGKSTIGYMIRSLLRSAGCTPALLGTIEYDLVGRNMLSSLTTPDAVTLSKHLIEARQAGATHAVMEVSSHSLHQRRTDGIRFDLALFTNLTQDHLDYHGTLEEYRFAKRRLFDRLSPEATAIVNADDAAGPRMIENCRAKVIRFGIDQEADIRAKILSEDNRGGHFLLQYQDKAAELNTPLVGRHNISNALAAASAGLALGLDLSTIRRGIESLTRVPGRLERVETGDSGFDVFVDYAHTDDALRNVLRSLRPLTRGRLWCVFGCGGDRDRTKRPLMARAVAEGADAFVITNDNPRTEDPYMILADIERGLSAGDRARGATIPDRAKAIERAIDELTDGDTLVIAGKGHEDYQILSTGKIHFDDCEVARSALAQKKGALSCAP
jgi:UDP-N-acetylmuramoyl-L-alanyl-D-glutamate--2,6-diaminopimelate ligase